MYYEIRKFEFIFIKKIILYHEIKSFSLTSFARKVFNKLKCDIS